MAVKSGILFSPTAYRHLSAVHHREKRYSLPLCSFAAPCGPLWSQLVRSTRFSRATRWCLTLWARPFFAWPVSSLCFSTPSSSSLNWHAGRKTCKSPKQVSRCFVAPFESGCWVLHWITLVLFRCHRFRFVVLFSEALAGLFGGFYLIIIMLAQSYLIPFYIEFTAWQRGDVSFYLNRVTRF